ncbi:hypothetical protein SAMN03159284_03556 [Mucilaginibacter sp. NFR10]|nr:hypothetical protein SAMN03159284_03556 [Mucilaginibacter sp. NFR10]
MCGFWMNLLMCRFQMRKYADEFIDVQISDVQIDLMSLSNK